MQRASFVVFAMVVAASAGLQAAPAGPALDFSTEPDETGDVFASSVEARYAAPISIGDAVADMRAAGMTCSQDASPTCSKSVSANGCTYTFVAKVTGTPARAVVRGETRNDC